MDVWAFYNRGVAFTSSGETQMVSTLHADTLLAVIAADEKTEWSPPVLGGASVRVRATRPRSDDVIIIERASA